MTASTTPQQLEQLCEISANFKMWSIPVRFSSLYSVISFYHEKSQQPRPCKRAINRWFLWLLFVELWVRVRSEREEQVRDSSVVLVGVLFNKPIMAHKFTPQLTIIIIENTTDTIVTGMLCGVNSELSSIIGLILYSIVWTGHNSIGQMIEQTRSGLITWWTSESRPAIIAMPGSFGEESKRVCFIV